MRAIFTPTAHTCRQFEIFCVELLTLTPFHRSSCGDSSPLRDVFTIQRGVATATATDVRTTEQEEKLEYWNREVTVMYDREAGTQIIQHQDSLTDYCSVSSECSLEPPGSDWPSTTGLGSPVSPCSDSLSPDLQDTSGNPSLKAPTPHEPEQDSVGTDKPPCAQLQAFTVLSVNRTLWIPRYQAHNLNLGEFLKTNQQALFIPVHVRDGKMSSMCYKVQSC